MVILEQFTGETSDSMKGKLTSLIFSAATSPEWVYCVVIATNYTVQYMQIWLDRVLMNANLHREIL